ncbi:MAG: hypothetical protein WBA93_19685 [Microcoleaceae cyanobacterium]
MGVWESVGCVGCVGCVGVGETDSPRSLYKINLESAVNKVNFEQEE